MLRIARISIRHPWTAISVWLVLVAAFGLVGSQIENRFAPSVIVAKGTESARAQQLALSRFGDSQLTPIMLAGPATQVDQQGTTLVALLRKRGDTRVISPWDGTPGSDVLRPDRSHATIVAAIERSEKDVIKTSLPEIERTVANTVSGPVTAHVTGQAAIDREIRDQSLHATRIAIAVAIPALFLVLLLVLRAPVAALLVTGFAASVLPVGYGLTALAASAIPVDAVAAAGAAMIGLALGAGFGLLVVSRFRDELAHRTGDAEGPAHAAARASATAGRAVLIAGTATVLAMVLASLLSLTEILNSIGIGATLMAAVSAAAAVGVLPAVLKVTGGRIGAASFGRPFASAGPGRLAAARRAAPFGIAAAAALAVMIALAAPVVGLSSGPPGPQLLPSDNQARKDYEAVAKAMGPGWLSPFEVVVARGSEPVTTRRFLAQLNQFERSTGRDRAVASVLGPGALLTNANELQGVPKGLNTAADTATKSKKDLKKLIAGLRLATDGVAQLRGGLGEAAGGAGQLHGGTTQAYGGSGQLKGGLDQANTGAQQLKAGAAQAAAGAKELAGGLTLAQEGVAGGLPAIDKLISAVDANAKSVSGLGTGASATKDEISAAASELAAMTVGRDDPRFGAVVGNLQQAAAENERLAAAITSAATTAQLNATTVVVIKQQVEDLQAGIDKLQAGGNQLSTGLHRLAGGNADLATGIGQLDAGGAKLQDGLRQLNDGAGKLATGLAAGAGPSGLLLDGMNTITGSVVRAREGIPSTKDLVKLRKEAPRLFDSGYFVLAAIDGAPPEARDAAAFVVNLARGGLAGRITVVPKKPARDASTRALYERLSTSAAVFAAATGAKVSVGGTGADLIDYRNTGLGRLPIVLAALALLTFGLLAAMTRSMFVPAAAVVLNLLTVTAVFGTLTLLFGGDSPLLGGPGFVDPVTMIAVTTVVLALSISYEVFTLQRLRPVYGVGLAMITALLPFAAAELTLVRQFALGLAIAVAIDAWIVRPVLITIQRRAPRAHRPRLHRPWLPPRPGLHHR